MTSKELKICWSIIGLLLIFGIIYAISNASHTPLTKQQEQELLRDHWDAMTPEERRKLK